MKNNKNHTKEKLIERQKNAFDTVIKNDIYRNKLRNFVRGKCYNNNKKHTNGIFHNIIVKAASVYRDGKKLLNDERFDEDPIEIQLEKAIYGIARNYIPEYFKNIKNDTLINLSSDEWTRIEERAELASEEIISNEIKYYKGFEKTLKRKQPYLYKLLLEGKSNKEIEVLSNRSAEGVRTGKNKLITKYKLYKRAVYAFNKYGETKSSKNIDELSLKLSIPIKELKKFFKNWYSS